MTVRLEHATAADTALLGNLLELYIHDLSVLFPQVQLGADGRFGYPELASYLAGSSERRAFLIRDGERLAGFVLARRGSPASTDPNVLDIAEFFVLRQFRGRKIGRVAAALVWQSMPGSWIIRAAEANAEAVRFWRGAVAAYTSQAKESDRSIRNSRWIVFQFDNAVG